MQGETPSSKVNQAAQERILLVDDNPANLQVLLKTLEGSGYKLLVAKNGATALTIASIISPQTSSSVMLRYPEMDLVVKWSTERSRAMNRFFALRELVDEIEIRVSPGTSKRLAEQAKQKERKRQKRRRAKKKREKREEQGE